MPWFYNGYIHLTQELALAPHLAPGAGSRVLDLGCGIGRWSRRLARGGATVVGVDLSRAMLDEAERRTERSGQSGTIIYRVEDLRALDLAQRFDLVFGVTVLQHVLLDEHFRAAVLNVSRHVAPGGRVVLLEAAPSAIKTTCDTPVFRARTASEYEDAFRCAGLRVVSVTGVDPAPFTKRVLPRYRRLPRAAALSAMFAATALSLPIDLLFGRTLVERSWHKVFVLECA